MEAVGAGRGAKLGRLGGPGGASGAGPERGGEWREEANLRAPANFIGLKSFCCRLPFACGAGLCVRRFWKVGSSHIPGRCLRPPLPRFSRHLTRGGGGRGWGAGHHHPWRGVPAATTLGCARIVAPARPARRTLGPPPAGRARAYRHLAAHRRLCGLPGRACGREGGAPFIREAGGARAGVASPAWRALSYMLMHRIFKTAKRTRTSRGGGKGELEGRGGMYLVNQVGIVLASSKDKYKSDRFTRDNPAL